MNCFKFLTRRKARFFFQIVLSLLILCLSLGLIVSEFFLENDEENQNLVAGFSLLLPLTTFWMGMTSRASEKEKEIYKVKKYLHLAKNLRRAGVKIDYNNLDVTTREKIFYNPTLGQGRIIFVVQCILSASIFCGSCIAIFLPYILETSNIQLFQMPGYFALFFLIGTWFGKPKIEKNKRREKGRILYYLLGQENLYNLKSRDVVETFNRR